MQVGSRVASGDDQGRASASSAPGEAGNNSVKLDLSAKLDADQRGLGHGVNKDHNGEDKVGITSDSNCPDGAGSDSFKSNLIKEADADQCEVCPKMDHDGEKKKIRYTIGELMKLKDKCTERPKELENFSFVVMPVKPQGKRQHKLGTQLSSPYGGGMGIPKKRMGDTGRLSWRKNSSPTVRTARSVGSEHGAQRFRSSSEAGGGCLPHPPDDPWGLKVPTNQSYSPELVPRSYSPESVPTLDNLRIGNPWSGHGAYNQCNDNEKSAEPHSWKGFDPASPSSSCSSQSFLSSLNGTIPASPLSSVSDPWLAPSYVLDSPQIRPLNSHTNAWMGEGGNVNSEFVAQPQDSPSLSSQNATMLEGRLPVNRRTERPFRQSSVPNDENDKLPVNANSHRYHAPFGGRVSPHPVQCSVWNHKEYQPNYVNVNHQMSPGPPPQPILSPPGFGQAPYSPNQYHINQYNHPSQHFNHAMHM
eukprot:CAMPEP_0203746044 /NCGR_PEP_ID=MMETSP0098-20131031/1602_1 /ASSEMBLY_ACC=CAM_ASM_000208 /TAXON_ID=96639 /ORGANISM=" , Strain NY0313808BC1" /LENGTH=472 /DNA_ID=CAMNT_0050634003 /DNA_START=21 /DNA_END=1439 /DNA_ORIENTATION=-